jgi:hypothetical protein
LRELLISAVCGIVHCSRLASQLGQINGTEINAKRVVVLTFVFESPGLSSLTSYAR